MPQTVTISQLQARAESDSEGSAFTTSAAVLGLTLLITVTVDAALNMIGRGIPSLSGSLLLSSHAGLAASAADEAARLDVHSKPFLGWVGAVVILVQAVIMLLGLASISLSRPRRWLGVWLRSPREEWRLGNAILCVIGMGSIGVVLFATWARVLRFETVDVSRGFLDRPQWAILLASVGVVACCVTAAHATIRNTRGNAQMTFVWTGLFIGAGVALSTMLAGKWLATTADFDLHYRAFDVFRAVQCIYATIPLGIILLWRTGPWLGGMWAPSYLVTPDSPGAVTGRLYSVPVGDRNSYPVINVKLSKSAQNDWRLFQVRDAVLREIAVYLRGDEWHRLDSGTLVLVRIPSSQTFRVSLQGILPLGLQADAVITFRALEGHVPTGVGPGYVDSDGRPHIDYGILQHLAALLDPHDPNEGENRIADVLGAVVATAAAAQLIRLEQGQAQVNAFLQGGVDRVAVALERQAAPPVGYGPSVTNLAILLPMAQQSAQIAAHLASLVTQAKSALSMLLAGQSNQSDSSYQPMSGLIRNAFFRMLSREVLNTQDSYRTHAAPPAVTDLVTETLRGLSSIINISASVAIPNRDQVLSEAENRANALLADSRAMLESIRQGAATVDIEHLRRQHEKAIEALGSFNTAYSSQALLSNPWLQGILQEWMTSQAPAQGWNSTTGAVSGQTTPSSTPANPPAGQGAATQSGSQGKTR